MPIQRHRLCDQRGDRAGDVTKRNPCKNDIKASNASRRERVLYLPDHGQHLEWRTSPVAAPNERRNLGRDNSFRRIATRYWDFDPNRVGQAHELRTRPAQIVLMAAAGAATRR